MPQYSFELLFSFKKKPQTRSVQKTCHSLCLPGCFSTVPCASSQVERPGWLLEFRGAVFIVLPEEECRLDFPPPPRIAQARVLRRPALSLRTSAHLCLALRWPHLEIVRRFLDAAWRRASLVSPPPASEMTRCLAGAGWADPAALGSGLGERGHEAALLRSVNWEVNTWG